MATLIAPHPKPLAHRSHASSQDGRSRQGCPDKTSRAAVGNPIEGAYLAVIVAPTAECGDAAMNQWQAEIKLVEYSRALRLPWPLPQWLDDYRDILNLALADGGSEHKRASRADEIKEFLRLLLSGHDKSAAELVRSLTLVHPFCAETHRLWRVQALFASIRPARSLTEALDFRIVQDRRDPPHLS